MTDINYAFYNSDGSPRDLDDSVVTNQFGEELQQLGLKSIAKEATKGAAFELLMATDWYVTRKAETGEAIPADVLTYRQAVRDASGVIESAIEACTTHDQYMALYDVPVDADGNPTGNAPINDWPEQ